jgi:hypothetical protein
MAIYEVGFLLGRCHLQKRITLSDGSEAIPLGPTGFAGEIHDVRALLEKAGFKFTRKDLTNTLANFRDAGHVVLLRVPAIDAASFSSAIDHSNAMDIVQTSYQPVLIDDEDADAFFRRWVFLLAEAVAGRLENVHRGLPTG